MEPHFGLHPPPGNSGSAIGMNDSTWTSIATHDWDQSDRSW